MQYCKVCLFPRDYFVEKEGGFSHLFRSKCTVNENAFGMYSPYSIVKYEHEVIGQYS